MAAFPVTSQGAVTCFHHGATPLTSDKRLTIGGGEVVLVEPFGPYQSCEAPDSVGKCVATVVAPPDSGTSRVLTVNGNPVLLSSLQATSTPAGTPVTVTAGQTVLTAS